jgi:hypothetical protein
MAEYNLVHLHVHRNEGPEYRDSIEIGTTKTGIIKCYGDASRPEEFRKRLMNAITLCQQGLAEKARVEGGSP